jgi:hypothetical protein
MPVIAYDMPERFVAGTVGQPGDRTFFLQARAGRRVTSVGLEKFQVTLLAERLEELLDEVLRQGAAAAVPAVAPVELQDDEPHERVVIEAQEVTEGEDEESEIGTEDPAVVVLRVRITAGQARAFAQRALKIVAAGRPPCPLCGLPLDAQGHVCPRQNGHLG